MTPLTSVVVTSWYKLKVVDCLVLGLKDTVSIAVLLSVRVLFTFLMAALSSSPLPTANPTI